MGGVGERWADSGAEGVGKRGVGTGVGGRNMVGMENEIL